MAGRTRNTYKEGSNVGAAVSHASKVSIANGVDRQQPTSTTLGEICINLSTELDRVRDVIALLDGITTSLGGNGASVVHRGVNMLALVDTKLATIVAALAACSLEAQATKTNTITNIPERTQTYNGY